MTVNLKNATDEFLERETVRLYERYQREFVEALNLCPWAKRASAAGQVALRVGLSSQFDPELCLTTIDDLTAATQTEIGLLIFPRLTVSREEFERFVSDVVSSDTKRMGLESPAFALAAFHPRAEPHTKQAERLIPFIRRSPDPTIQLVRISALERVRQGDVTGTQYFDPRAVDLTDPARVQELFGESRESLRERVSKANLESIQSVGVERATELLDEIAADRQKIHDEYARRCAEQASKTASSEARS